MKQTFITLLLLVTMCQYGFAQLKTEVFNALCSPIRENKVYLSEEIKGTLRCMAGTFQSTNGKCFVLNFQPEDDNHKTILNATSKDVIRAYHYVTEKGIESYFFIQSDRVAILETENVEINGKIVLLCTLSFTRLSSNTAWMAYFEGSDLPTLMRQIHRAKDIGSINQVEGLPLGDDFKLFLPIILLKPAK